MTSLDVEKHTAPEGAPAFLAHVPLPTYLEQTYWWAYLHPKGVRFFERQWLVNLILWGNYATLRDAVFAEIGSSHEPQKVLQIACVYGDFTEQLAKRIGPQGRLDVVDVTPVQLENLRRKLKGQPGVALHHQDSVELAFADKSYDYVVAFFLLHEQPEQTRARTVKEAMRVARPGGKVIFVDYHQPDWNNPLRYIMMPVLRLLEPFALGMWQNDVLAWLPESSQLSTVTKQTYFGGLYQKVVITA